MLKNLYWQKLQHDRLKQYVEAEPSNRFKKSPLYENAPAWNFAKALVSSVSILSENVFLNGEAAWLADETEHADPLVLNRVVSFLAWSCEFEYQEGARALVNEESQDQISRLDSWLKVTVKVKEIMYPQDEVVQRAISEFQSASHEIDHNEKGSQPLFALRQVVNGIIRGTYLN